MEDDEEIHLYKGSLAAVENCVLEGVRLAELLRTCSLLVGEFGRRHEQVASENVSVVADVGMDALLDLIREQTKAAREALSMSESVTESVNVVFDSIHDSCSQLHSSLDIIAKRYSSIPNTNKESSKKRWECGDTFESTAPVRRSKEALPQAKLPFSPPPSAALTSAHTRRNAVAVSHFCRALEDSSRVNQAAHICYSLVRSHIETLKFSTRDLEEVVEKAEEMLEESTKANEELRETSYHLTKVRDELTKLTPTLSDVDFPLDASAHETLGKHLDVLRQSVDWLLDSVGVDADHEELCEVEFSPIDQADSLPSPTSQDLFVSENDLVCRATSLPSHSFVEMYLVTFRLYMTPTRLFERLVLRYCCTPPAEVEDPHGLQLIKKNRQVPIRLRVLNVLRLWLETHPRDFARYLRPAVRRFVDDIAMNTGNERLGEKLGRIIGNLNPHRSHDSESLNGKIMGDTSVMSPETVSGKQHKSDLSFLSCDITELARHVTLQTYYMARQVDVSEILDHYYNDVPLSSCPTLQLYLDYLERRTEWAKQLILSETDDRVATNAIETLIKLTSECVSLNDFGSGAAMFQALTSSDVKARTRAWHPITSTQSKAHKLTGEVMPVSTAGSHFRTLSKLFGESNRATYREKVSNTPAPTILVLDELVGRLREMPRELLRNDDDLLNLGFLSRLYSTVSLFAQLVVKPYMDMGQNSAVLKLVDAYRTSPSPSSA